MKYDVLFRSIGWHSRHLSLSSKRLLVLGASNMASRGHLLGLQLPPVPSHLSDFMPACVRATHSGDAKECSSLSSPDVHLQPPRNSLQGASPAQQSSNGLMPFAPLRSRFGTTHEVFADLSILEQAESITSRSTSGVPPSYGRADNEEVRAKVQGRPSPASSARYADQNEMIKQADKYAGKKVVASETPLPYSPSVWVPYFNLGNKDVDARVSHDPTPGAESPPPTPPGEDILACFNSVMSKDVGENSQTHSRGIRSKISSMLSLEKRGGLVSSTLIPGLSNYSMNEMSGIQSCASTRRAAMTESRVFDSNLCPSNRKESFSHMFDCPEEVEKDNVFSVPGQDGGCSGRSIGDWDTGLGADSPWTEASKSNGGWSAEPWHSEQRNILMRTLHIMRCDIESLKMMLRALEVPLARSFPFDPHIAETLGHTSAMHSVMSSSTSATSEMKPSSCGPIGEVHSLNRIDQPKADKELACNSDKELACNSDKDILSNADRDLFASGVPRTGKGDDNCGPINRRSRGGPKKQKWWREILTALGLTVWVIAGAVFVAKVIGVPNLGVTNVAYKRWGSDDDETSIPKGALGVMELSSYTFNDVIKRRPTFVMFYAPWCPHCQRLHPTWTKLASTLGRKGVDVQLAIVDATKHTRLADKYEVPGFPTLILFKNGTPVGRHRGARDLDTLLAFVDSHI